MPPLKNGLHRKMRPVAFQAPRQNPYFASAMAAYSEHVGSKRQTGGKRGESHRL